MEATNDISLHKKLVKPDKAKHEAQIAKINDEIAKLQTRMAEVRAELDSARDGRSGMSEQMQGARDKMAELRATKEQLIGDRTGLLESLKNSQGQLDDHSKNQKNLRHKLEYTSAAEIDAQIAILDRKQGTQSMSLAEEKKVLKEIEALRKSKKLVEKFSGRQGQIDQTRDSVQVIRAKLTEKKKEIDAITELIDEQKKVMDELRSSTPNTKDHIPQLHEERTQLKATLDDKFNEIRSLKSEFKDSNNAYFAAVNLQKEARKKAKEEEDNRAQAEYQEKLALYEQEMEKLHPFQDQLDLCDALITYLEATFISKNASREKNDKSETNNNSAPSMGGLKPLQRKEEEVYGSIPLKNKKGKAKKAKDVKLSLPIARVDSFSSIGVTPPTTIAQVSIAIEKIKEKKEFFANSTRESKTKDSSNDASANTESKSNEGRREKEGKKKQRHFDASSAEFPTLGGEGVPAPASGVWSGTSAVSSTNEVASEENLEQEA